MTSQQYEELCRFFIAHEMKIDLAHVVSRVIPNPCREREPGHWDPDPQRNRQGSRACTRRPRVKSAPARTDGPGSSHPQNLQRRTRHF